MSFAPDDLAPLLFPPVRGDFGFHQGKVVTWDQSTGENTILVAGATLVDVPILNGTEVPLLEPDHIVGMLRFKSSYFILGRIIIPNTPDIGALPGMLVGSGQAEAAFSLSTVSQSLASSLITVPPWANQALVMCTANAVVKNTGNANGFVTIAAEINDGQSGQMFTYVNVGQFEHVSAASQFLFGVGSDLPLGADILIAAEIIATNTWAADASNYITAQAIAMFRKA